MEPGEFEGKVGRDFSDSAPWWPDEVRARPGSPNVVIVVLDDVGFAQLGCFGSDLATPTFDRLASGGLRYVNFHTTALCSPTRSCVITGRNHHVNGMGRIPDLATGFPGYDARIPRSNGFLSEMLLNEGYATFAIGKWHLTPRNECHLAARRDRWPLRRGFERFYGFFGGDTHQFVPSLFSDNHPIPPPRSAEEGYHLTEDLVDQAIRGIADLKAIDDEKPFFLYFCTGACHAPHQAPREWIDRYRGHFDGGWDDWRNRIFARQLREGIFPEGTEMSPLPEWVPPWPTLTADERRLYARYMEAFAGFLSHTDHEVGRLVEFLESTGELDNTILMVLSDNGASSEGGPTGSINNERPRNLAPSPIEEALERIEEIGGPYCNNNYPWGWTVAGNTPFRRWKREVHEGGIADPLIVHWPAGMKSAGEVRRQYVHAVDILPTVMEAVGTEIPSTIDGVVQRPVDGVSFMASFDDAVAPSARTTQYYEMLGCRALYHEGWKVVTYHPIQDTRVGFDEDHWELYHVAVDPAECHDVAAENPAKVRELVERWWVEAGRNQVLPLDNRALSSFVLERPRTVPERARYVYYPDGSEVPEEVAVNVRNRSHTVRARVELPASIPPAEGTLVSLGTSLGGWVLYVQDNRLCYVHNYVGLEEHRAVSHRSLPSGPHELGFRFLRTAEHAGAGQLLLDGEVIGEVSIPRFTPNRFCGVGGGLTCGYSSGLPVPRECHPPFPFTGKLHEVVIEVEGLAFEDPEAEARIAIRRQ